MDVDLYMVCRGAGSNKPNLLYENMGNGQFIEVQNAGGAAGVTVGKGESVAAADYDQDGFIDLFVTNGFQAAPFNEGPAELFTNTGNNNNWVEIDLQGTASNRQGIGARVFLTTRGRKQVRLQDGGTHQYSQNFRRLHFGLGGNTLIDHLEIQWPSGLIQVLTDVPSNQIVSITEGEGLTSTVYEDFEDGTIAGWDIYDASPSGATISNVFDAERNSHMIAVSGASTDMLRGWGSCDWQAEPGLGNVHHLHSNGPRFCVPGCRHGLVLQARAIVARIEYTGFKLLC